MKDDKSVRTWMSPVPVTIDPTDSVLDAYRKLKKHNIRRLPVVDGAELVGILTITDVRRAAPMGSVSLLEQNTLLANTPVARLMTRNPITIRPQESIGEAARLMMKHKIGGLPVVDNGRVVGVISEADIFRRVIAETWAPESQADVVDQGEETLDVHIPAEGEIMVHIRPIRPDDIERLQSSHVQMSPETIYDRFMGYKKELATPEARYLTCLDYDRHMALVATTYTGGKETIIGVARYHVLDFEPGCAEFAIVVSDRFQRCKIGTFLFKRLIEYAARHEIRTFLGITHRENRGLLRLVEATGVSFERRFKNDTLEVWLQLVDEGVQAAAPEGA
jgi:predicted transcriptional regulator